MQQLAVVGSRGFTNKQVIWHELMHYLTVTKGDLAIVSGGARGVDSLAAEFAREHRLKLLELLPEWDRYGRSAGFKRNHTIWAYADSGIAFWDGHSKGTAHSFQIARDTGKPLRIIDASKDYATTFINQRSNHATLDQVSE